MSNHGNGGNFPSGTGNRSGGSRGNGPRKYVYYKVRDELRGQALAPFILELAGLANVNGDGRFEMHHDPT